MSTSPIERAVAEIGSQSALAKAIGVAPAMVWQWCDGRRPVPAHRCVPIEEATQGKVTRYELRPDVFGEAPVKARKRAA